MNAIVDTERGRETARLLHQAFTTTGIHGRKEMPEDVTPKGVTKGSLEHLLFITLTVSIDYQRDANVLWENSRRTYEDTMTRYLFDLRSLHLEDYHKVVKDMQKYELSKKPNKDANIWRTVGITFYKKWNGDPRYFLKDCGWDASTILERLKSDVHINFGKQVADYPYLRGDKIGPLWIRMMRDNVGLTEIHGLERVPIPVDIHVARATLALGVVRGRYRGSLNEFFDVIRKVWFASVKGLEVEGRPMIALDVDESLWHLSKYGCTDREKSSGNCAHFQQCELKDYCIPGNLEINQNQVLIETGSNGSTEGEHKNPLTLCVVPCGARKIWGIDPEAGPTRAADVYIGPFSKKCQEYARKFYMGRWCILSAKYGFVGPSEIIPSPYNVSFNNPKSKPITVNALTKQAKDRGLGVFNEVVILGGKNYVEIIEKVFVGKLVRAPLKGTKGIGYMMGNLKKAIIEGKPL